ncbi:MAG: flippase-like domain-containing protein [Candidatus Omnitrophota bacterium]|nr:MAG: flippase-like domain-containing protein [Candidatus Omnitrophota bacterium]
MAKRYYRLIGILILIIILSRLDFNRLFSNLSKVNLAAFFLINLLIVPVIFLKSLRWRYILQFQSIYYSIKDIFLIYLSGIYAGLATPGRLGEAFKALYLRNEKNVSLGRGLATVFIDRLCDLYLLLAIGLFGIWKLCLGVNNWFTFTVIIFLLIIAPFVLVHKKSIIGLARYLQNINLFKKYKYRLKFHYEEFSGSIKEMNIGRALLLIGITLSSALLYFWQCYWLISLLGLKIPFLTVVLFISILNLVNLLPITVMGIGTREVTLIYLFSLIGLSAEEATAASFLLFVSFYLLTGIIAFFGWHVKVNQVTLASTGHSINKEKIHRADSSLYSYIYQFISEIAFLIFGGGTKFRQSIYSSSDKINKEKRLKILDIGCGNGALLSYMTNATDNIDTIVGADISLDMINLSKKRIYKGRIIGKHCVFVVSLAQLSPFKDNSFDIIFNVFLLHHQPREEKLKVLLECRRVLKTGGEIITVDVDRPVNKIGWLIAFTRWHIPQVRDSFRQSLIEMHKQAGYQNLKMVKRKFGVFSFVQGAK